MSLLHLKSTSSKLWVIALFVAALTTWIFWPETTSLEPKSSISENRSRTAQASIALTTSSPVPAPANAGSSSASELFIYDRSSIDDKLLIAKTRADNSTADSDQTVSRDLWLQDDEANERLIATDVIWARFSPDGGKIAYVSNARELFIQTLQGESLAQVQNVSDPNWRPDSLTLSFQAVPSDDYPELQQTVVYDLNAGKVIQAAENVRAN